jgi:hypothetical protein
MTYIGGRGPDHGRAASLGAGAQNGRIWTILDDFGRIWTKMDQDGPRRTGTDAVWARLARSTAAGVPARRAAGPSRVGGCAARGEGSSGAPGRGRGPARRGIDPAGRRIGPHRRAGEGLPDRMGPGVRFAEAPSRRVGASSFCRSALPQDGRAGSSFCRSALPQGGVPRRAQAARGRVGLAERRRCAAGEQPAKSGARVSITYVICAPRRGFQRCRPRSRGRCRGAAG